MKRLLPISVLLLCTLIPLWSENADISIKVYELEDYVRHPRMEEQDRLKGGNPAFRPGLEIISNIDDVEIRFFDLKVGRTPAEWDNLDPGAYQVQLRRSGYEPLEFWVTVRSDRRTVVYVTMGSPMGTLKLKGLPPGASASFNRVPLDSTTIRVPAGAGSLKVTAFGWEPVSTNVLVKSGEETVWTYAGQMAEFSLQAPRIRPRRLPADDRRGFRIDWEASAPGSGEMTITGPTGDIIDRRIFDISDYAGTFYWIQTDKVSADLPEGEYTVKVSGTGGTGIPESAESRLTLDNRFIREPRPNAHPLPGLMYAPGTSMLPPGIWQASTTAGFDIGTGSAGAFTGIPAGVALRIAPGKRWELSGKFGMRATDPFDDTSLDLSLSGSWRISPAARPFEANLALLYYHRGLARDFAEIPLDTPGMQLPGLQLSLPMEYAFGRLSVVLTPSANLFFPGSDPADWTLGTPAAFTGSVAAGAYWETGRYLVGASTAVRSPDVSGSYLDWTMWSGLEGRFDLPGEASYFAAWCGIRYLDVDPVVSLGLEFVVIR